MDRDAMWAGRLADDLDGAFPAVVRAHQDAVFATALRFCGCHQTAEDLAQDAFVSAYRALTGYDQARRRALAIRPWLMTIVLNACRNDARRRGRRPATVALDTEVHPDHHATVPTIDDGALTGALSSLTGAQRDAVILRYAADLPYADVAAVLHRPIGTVKSDVHRALATLRSHPDLREDTP